MSRGRSERPGSADLPLIFGCVANSLWRRRVDGALRTVAVVRWFESFADLRDAVASESARVVVAVVDIEDRTGASAHGFARTISEVYAGIGIVAYDHPERGSEADICLLGASGVHDVLVAGLTDEGYVARSIIMGACLRGAGELVMSELRTVLPPLLIPFADAVVRNPAKANVTRIAQHLNVHRQTPSVWCKREAYMHPEELLVWCRVLLVSAMLELTSRTLDSIALELEYGSPTALRNQLKNYTGMTATQIRGSGMGAVLEVFKGSVPERQAGRGGEFRSGQTAEMLVFPARNAG